ncbi:glycosyltransferase family 61 protein [Aneurinibacillus tyrosinisolvens]|uniref:glycosyltransferase family 61 protein n=1 Tax=Aneurinibacillus tyrosinisolvens TaxID=1443435 RepID=UPI00063F1A84|nr:glycosyltransferase family 61 protein [Aneurinibacillus tyrosinisolvens]
MRNTAKNQSGNLGITKITKKIRANLRNMSCYFLLRKSPLFNSEYYLQTNPDVKDSKVNPILHFIFHGVNEGRNPHPLFDINYYLLHNPDVRDADINPLVHYLRYGGQEGRRPHPLFDVEYYVAQCGRDIQLIKNPLLDYLMNGFEERLSTHPLFDARFYIEQYMNDEKEITPLHHFLMDGCKSGASIHSVFSEFSFDESKSIVIRSYFTEGNEPTIQHLKYNPELRDSLINYLKECRFEAFDNLFRRSIRLSPLQKAQTVAKTFAEIKFVKDAIKENGQLLHHKNQEGWSFYSRTDNNEFLLTPPEEYIGILNNVSLVGGTRLLFNQQGQLLHDELASFSGADYGVKTWQYVKVGEPHIAEVYNTKVIPNNTIKEGILISCDHDNNYFHWLIECLTKVLMISQFKEFEGVPLLIGRNLNKNYINALEKIVNNRFPIFQLEDGSVYDIKRLIYPSDLSRILDRYNGKMTPDTDIVLSREWLQLIRQELLRGKGSLNYKQKGRKLYLTRRGGTYRKVLNEHEIELELLKDGFEIVDLNSCSFDFQLEIFNQADLIVAPTGATVTNMLFVPPNTKFVVFVSEHPGNNLYIWEQLADICSVDLTYCFGERAFARQDLHDDFTINLPQLLATISNIEHCEEVV